MFKSQQVLRRAGWLFFASALFHVGVWWLAGLPSLDGPVSWRKPITFGLSTAVLFFSLAWVVGLLPDTRARLRQAWLFTVLLVAEVALIDMQQWRGVASHFNDATRLDAAVFRAMGALILTASVVVALWTVALFRHRLTAPPAYALAARAGMLLLNLGNLIGLLMATTGSTTLRPLHGLTLHALQALPLAVWALAHVRYARAWLVWSRVSRWWWPPRWQAR